MRILRHCLWSAVFVCTSALVFAQAPPTGDTYSNSNNKNQTNGSNIFLVVQHGSDSYIKFNLATLPASPSIAKATMRLYVDAVVSGGSFDVYQLNSSWSESTLTYNNAPALGSSATGSHPVAITTSSMNQFVIIDITTLVVGWANGTIANNGIALALTTTNGSFSFDAKESILTSHHPELEIVLNGAVGSQGPAGPAGATGATGPAGAAGAQGVQGPAGPTGPAGALGPIGPIGPTGGTGAQGALGPQGPIGLTGATGSQGATGAQGLQGLMGLTGPQGSQGVAGSNGTGFNFTGPFNNQTSYSIDDVATYNGSTYLATVANQSGNTPDLNTTDWTLMAQAGATGAVGAAGTQGAQGPQGSVGSIGPQGPAGPGGATGATGAQGAQGLLGPTGPRGPQGDLGPAGTNGTGFNFTGPFSSGTSYNLNDVATYNGSTYVATVANQGGNTPDQNIADWTLMAQAGATGPVGAAGAQGSQGLPGTPGATGAQGPMGQSGANGAQGPQGIQGPIGPQGATGAQGPAGTSSGGVLYVVPFSATPIFDAGQGSVLEITLTGNITSSTLANAAAGQTLSIILCQDSVGGHTFVPPINVQWSTVGTTTPGYCVAEQFAFDGTIAYYLGPIAYQVVAPITNLTGSGLALSMNGGTVAVPSAATTVSLPSLYSGQTYQLSVAQQPTAPPQTCTLVSTVGIVKAANVNAPVNCVGAPGTPTSPVLTSPAAYQLTTSWTPPASTGGAALTGYTVRLTNTGDYGGTLTQTVGGTATSAAFTGVNPGCQQIGYVTNCGGNANFTFTVTAINTYGSGAASGASNAIGSPGPPTNISDLLLNPYGSNCNGNCDYSVSFTLPTVTGGVPLTQECAISLGNFTIVSCGGGSPIFAQTSISEPFVPLMVAVNAFGAVSVGVYH